MKYESNAIVPAFKVKIILISRRLHIKITMHHSS